MKVYKIIDNTNGNVYIGKTKKKYLCNRLAEHKYDYKINKPCMSRDIIKNGDYKIELIEETEDDTRERYWIENTECINKIIPGRNRKEYRENNKEKIKKYQSEYRKNNKEKLSQYTREYRKNNKEKLSQYIKSWGDARYYNNLLKIDVNLFI